MLFPKDLQIWEVKIGDKQKSIIQIRIKSPKENRIGSGITLEIFENESFICPVKAIKKWLRFHKGSEQNTF